MAASVPPQSPFTLWKKIAVSYRVLKNKKNNLQKTLAQCNFCNNVNLKLVYIGNVFMAISPVTATHDSHYLLALATLGDVKEIGSLLFMSRCTRWPRQVQVCHCRLSLLLALSCHLHQCKHRFNADGSHSKQLGCHQISRPWFAV